MEKSSYNEMLRLLSEDKKRLKAELEQIEIAINALTALKTGNSNARLTNDSSTNETNRKSSRKNYYEDADVSVPPLFTSELSPLQLLLFALNEKEIATVEQATDYIMTLDNTKDRRYIFTRFRDIASGLFRAKKIHADTKNKEYKYSLKEIIKKEVSFEEKVKNEIDKVFKI